MTLEFSAKIIQNNKIAMILTSYSECCSWYGMWQRKNSGV